MVIRRLRPVLFFVFVFCFAGAVSDIVSAATEAVVSERLERALIDPDFPWWQDDGRLAVWVFFSDKGLTGASMDEALDVAAAELGKKSRGRRAKMARARGTSLRVSGRGLVDMSDLAVHGDYVDRVTATGADARRRSRWLNAASFDVRPEQLRMIAALDCVRRVDLMARFVRPLVPVSEPDIAAVKSRNEALADRAVAYGINYGGSLAQLEQINVPAVHEAGFHGEGILVGMLDSGFRTTHEALLDIPVIGMWDFVNNDGIVDTEIGDPSTSHNHGTQTLSTLMGFKSGGLVGPACAASVVLAKTEDVADEQPIEEDNWVAGIEWLDTFGVDVVSSSLAYLEWYTFEDMDGGTAVCTIAADLAVGKGIVVVNSAGNERGRFDHIIAPADGDSVIAAGAVDAAGDYSSFSSPGPTWDGRIKPDICALGSGNHVVSPSNDYSYQLVSGTSFSGPLAAGVAALVLSRNPGLTPMQVREAMRQTADRAANPDNDYGWGLLDAYAAVFYHGTIILHEPLRDTENTTSPNSVVCSITARSGVDPASPWLYSRVDGGSWRRSSLVAVGGDDYAGEIPAVPGGGEVEYYLSAGDTHGIVVTDPIGAPASVYSFTVGEDVEVPVLFCATLLDQPLISWPPTFTAEATDNLGIAEVYVSWTWNGVPQAEFVLPAQGDDLYSAVLPLAVDAVAVDDVFTWTATAVDQAAMANETVAGPFSFTVIDALGVVVVIDDVVAARDAGDKVDLKYDARKQLLTPPALLTPLTTAKSAADSIVVWLEEAGYVTSRLLPAEATAEALAGNQAVILSCGDNTSPLADADMRQSLRDWVAGGGRLLVEGGEVGYDAVSSPGYPDFADQVLHVGNWRGDNAGDLGVVSGRADHALLKLPHELDPLLHVSYSFYGDQDAIDPAADSLVLMQPAGFSGAAGILVYDDNPAPQAVQIVYFAFNLSAMHFGVGRQLVENAVACLLAEEAPPTASIAGEIRLRGQSDHAGVTVSADGVTIGTGPSGAFLLDNLYHGPCHIEAVKDGWSVAVLDVEVAEGEALTGIELVLHPLMLVEGSASPGRTIPDNDDAGIASTIDFAAGGAVSSLTVDIDITHTWRGDLTVDLTSPGGITVRLHDRGGVSADDLQGNYPASLAVEGPGDLTDFTAENLVGVWTLHVVDHVGSDIGTLNSWGLHILAADELSGVESCPPHRTVLHVNAPNPFNPRTMIAFEVATAGPVRMEIFDLRGRLVRLLHNGPLKAGPHTLSWDGCSADGRSVSSGTYLYRLNAGDVRLERKMLLLR